MPGMQYFTCESYHLLKTTLAMQGTYYEAAVTDIHPAEQALTARFPKHAGLEQFEFKISYDILVYSVGSKVNTFGIKVSTVT